MDRLKKIGVFLALLAILGGGAVLLFWDLGAECRSILTSGVGEGNYLLTASDAENVFILLSTRLLPPVIAGLVMAGILAATISSSDSYLLIAASAFAKNIYQGLWKKDATEQRWQV